MIFYLSCTGNTLWAARELARQTGEQLVSMADPANVALSSQLRRGERLGFCFPVHGWRPPVAVRTFVRNIKCALPEDTFCYAVCTAGDTVGEAMNLLKHDLSNVGITLDSAFSLLMPNTYVGLLFMDVDPPALQRSKKEHAAEALSCYSEFIVNKKKGVFEISKGRWPRINSRLLGALFFKYLVTDNPFHVDKIRCISCGRCAAVCPVGDISFIRGAFPEWRHNGNCLTCFACYHHCPRHCIAFGRRTKGKGQYFFN